MKTKFFPATEIIFPEDGIARRAAFYLAAEEYVARTFPEGSYLFSWILNKTVVIGRNQVAHKELDIDFCKENGIDIIRRKSGGGAVFADRNNIMWSLVTYGGDVESVFGAYSNSMSNALVRLGVPAEVSGRNDILLKNGKKICGNAFYHLSNRNIVHGTMLYDTTMELMKKSLLPAPDKLKARGVQSVRSRVGFIKEYYEGNIESLRLSITKNLCDKSLILSSEDINEIIKIEQTYYTDEYLWGSVKGIVEKFCRHVDGCGEICISCKLHGSMIEDVVVSGDFFELEDANSAFSAAFQGIPFTHKDMTDAIMAHHPERSIRGLSTLELIEILKGDH